MMPTSRNRFRVAVACACLIQLAFGFGPIFSPSILSQTPLEKKSTPVPTSARDGFDCDRPMSCDSHPWTIARTHLSDPECCIVSVYSPRNTTSSSSGRIDNNNPSDDEKNIINPLEAHLAVLQERLADKGPSDMDIRARIDTTTFDSALQDCLTVCSSLVGGISNINEEPGDNPDNLLPQATALAQLALGMASFADDCGIQSRTSSTTNSPNANQRVGVFVRIVCASSYRAHDPVFHTDKAPLRGYATLRGVGTEFVTHPCSPLEYLSLRSLGQKLPRWGGGDDSKESQEPPSLRRAAEKEFIVMKGDYYYRGNSPTAATTGWWQRAFACVHRSPPGTTNGSRRVIVSFDLADGDDDREWHDAHQKRKWRAGMTQRKSKLVA